jgi:hypothetical protein
MSKLVVLLGRWGSPPDDVAWLIAAAGLALVIAALASRDLLDNMRRVSRARFLATASLAAGFLTLGYAAHYLRGGPRIIDATTYVLQAKALAHGHLAWHVPFPSASFRGRFLLFREDAGTLAGIFPPGWPLVFAVGFVLGSPMLVGVALSAGLVVATYALARELAPNDAMREPAARLAALLSIVCAALRYQCADPMSHAASALAITIALVCALRASRGDATARTFVALGACVGYVACTRPFSALPIFVVAAFLVRRTSRRDIASALFAIVPGVLFLLVAQRIATGHFFDSTQRAYYAVSDGPPDCFRYGFGQGIGCLHEHGDFVRARLQNGFGFVAALGTTLRRIHLHLSDALAAWPVALVVAPACIAHARRDSRARIAWALVLLQILVYFPFYFDGDYPGGGARFYADILPIEHALVAVSVLATFPKLLSIPLKSTALVGLVAFAFGVHGAFDHLALADRDGGRPMFEPERLQDARVENGLLFIDTDHGFDLAYDPAATDPKRALVVARLRNDSHDRLLYEDLGRPATWAYRFSAQKESTLLPFTPPPADVASRELWRFESEADWPPLAQEGAWAEPIFATGQRQNCPSNGQALELHASPSGSVTIAVPIPRKGAWSVHPWLLTRPGDSPITLALASLRWTSTATTDKPTCTELAPQSADFEKGEIPLELTISGGVAAIDRIELTPSR